MNCCLYLLYILDKYIGNFRPWNLSTLCQPLGSVAPTFTSSYLKKLTGDLEMWLVQDSYFGGILRFLKTDIWLKVIKELIGGVEERLHKGASEEPLDPLIYHQPQTFLPV